MNKISKHNFYIFPFLWLLVLCLSILESFTFPGFLYKSIFFGFQFFLLFYILSGFLLRSKILILSKNGNNFYKFLGQLNNILLPIILLITFITSAVEVANYRDYFLNKIHLQPKNLYWTSFIVLFAVILNLKNLGKKWFLDKLILQREKSSIIVLALLGWLVVFNIRSISGIVFKNLFFIAQHPLVDYDFKMRYQWGDFYDYMVFLRENTPSEAKMAHPPWEIPPWLSTGSQPLVRYFLYPRQLFQTKDITSLDPKADYAMIAWGFWQCPQKPTEKYFGQCSYGWPKVKINAEWIIYKEEKSARLKKKIENTIYDPDDKINKNAWGLIKIKKEP